jgi:hypothetical protein
MSVLAIVLIALGVAILLVLVGGVIAVRRRARREDASGSFERHLDADQALEAARAADKGWDRAVMERAAREAVAEARPGSDYELYLVLVDDRPGVEEDRAQFMAVAGGERVHVTLARREGGWVPERIE